MIKTDHILFIASGAFHLCKPSDLVPELQGRFPIRVELKALGQEEFFRILTEPKNALLKQYVALMKTEGIDLVFADDGVLEMARLAAEVNQKTEDIRITSYNVCYTKLLRISLPSRSNSPLPMGSSVRLPDNSTPSPGPRG